MNLIQNQNTHQQQIQYEVCVLRVVCFWYVWGAFASILSTRVCSLDSKVREVRVILQGDELFWAVTSCCVSLPVVLGSSSDGEGYGQLLIRRSVNLLDYVLPLRGHSLTWVLPEVGLTGTFSTRLTSTWLRGSMLSKVCISLPLTFMSCEGVVIFIFGSFFLLGTHLLCSGFLWVNLSGFVSGETSWLFFHWQVLMLEVHSLVRQLRAFRAAPRECVTGLSLLRSAVGPLVRYVSEIQSSQATGAGHHHWRNAVGDKGAGTSRTKLDVSGSWILGRMWLDSTPSEGFVASGVRVSALEIGSCLYGNRLVV